MQMLLFKECEVFAPQPLGVMDVLCGGGRILAMADRLDVPAGFQVKTIQASGLKMIPGLIDSHVHIAGAGGEGGPATRTPEMPLGMMLEAGVTTVIGCLGTDGMTRSLQSVLMKVKALRKEGVSAWMYTGAYQVPTPTMLGDVGKDIAMIDEVIGTGEIAISDHRSSGPSVHELIRLAAHSRVGAMLGGKSGIVNIHMGDADDPFSPLYAVVAGSELSLKQFLPTHCNRNEHIFEEAKTYGLEGYVDLTTSSYPFFPEDEIKPSTGVVALMAAGVPPEHITMSSDGCGSLPQFDDQGNLVRFETGNLKSLFDEFRDMVLREGLKTELALRPVTSNVADILKLPSKGRVEVGRDADLVLLDDRMEIVYMTAMGQLMVSESLILRKGAYEK